LKPKAFIVTGAGKGLGKTAAQLFVEFTEALVASLTPEETT